MRFRPFIFLSLALLLFTVSAWADLAFFLTPAAQSGVGNNEVFFTGTLTNTSLTDKLFLNNIQFGFINAATNYLSADTNAFFANVPGILLPGETYGDVVFGISVAPATPPGQYFCLVTIQGGADILAATSLSNQTAQVSLPPAALSITVSGTNLVLSWPSPPGSFVLQQNYDLTTTNWTEATNMPIAGEGQNQVIVNPVIGNQFYRLKYP